MSYICRSPELYDRKKVRTGQCVEFVKKCSGAPSASSWRKGVKVMGNQNMSKGIAIATFDSNGRYPNNATGNHAAIYIGQDATGIWVYDQWVRKGCVSKRYIRLKGTTGMSSNDADDYYVIE